MPVEQMGREDVERFLKSKSSGVLGLSFGSIPYCVPLAYGYDGESVYFIIQGDGRLLNYLKSSKVACFSVSESSQDSSSYISVLIEGPVSRVEGPEVAHAISFIERQLRKQKGSLLSQASSAAIYKLSARTCSGRKK